MDAVTQLQVVISNIVGVADPVLAERALRDLVGVLGAAIAQSQASDVKTLASDIPPKAGAGMGTMVAETMSPMTERTTKGGRTPSKRNSDAGTAVSATAPRAGNGEAKAKPARRVASNRPNRSPTAGKPGRRPPALRLAAREWLALRRQVDAELRRRGLDREALAPLLGLAVETVRSALARQRSPSGGIVARLHAFLAETGRLSKVANVGEAAGAAPGKAVQPAEPAAASGGWAGPQPAHASAVAAGRAELAKQVKAKRRLVPVTSPTLAQTIGVTLEDLDAALAARPVPPIAAERLAAWVSA
jgi:hypothetical protein